MVSVVKVDTFTDYLERKVSEGTTKLYVHVIKLWFEWLQIHGGEPTQDTAQEYLDQLHQLHRAPNTIAVRANAIKKWFKWKGEKIELESPKIRIGEPKYITMDDLHKVLVQCETPLQEVLVVALFDTGCRISELLGVKMGDMDWEHGMVRMRRKGGRTETVNISDRGLDALRKWIQTRMVNSERMFMDLEYQDVLRIVKRVGDRAGVKLTPHVLRHSRAVQMLDAGADIHTVQGVLGHTSINTTMDVYARLRPVDLKKKIPSW